MFAITQDPVRQAVVFQAPVLTPYDVEYQNKPNEDPFRLPAGFWKIVAMMHQGKLRAAAFLVWQRDFDKVEPETFDPLLEQVRVTTIEFLTGLSFPQIIRDADPLHFTSERALTRFMATVVPDIARDERRAGLRFIRKPADIQL